MNSIPQNQDTLQAIVISGMKCGSTWLSDILARHPEIRHCLFSVDYEQEKICPVDLPPPGLKHKILVGRRNLKLNPKDPRIYARHNPDLKFLALIRHPIERAYSQFVHHVNKRSGKNRMVFPNAHGTRINGKTVTYDFNACLPPTAPILPSFVRKSFYFETFTQYFQCFPKERFLVFPLELFQKEPEACFQKIFSFLGVSYRFDPSWIHQKVNEGKYRPHSWLDTLLFKKKVVIQPITLETQHQLAALYRQDVLKMSEWLGLDLESLWNLKY